MKAAALFCGYGGASRGMKQAGLTVVKAYDWSAQEVEAHRWLEPDIPCERRDVSTVTPEELRGLFVWASPSCKPWSTANRTKTRGRNHREYYSLAKHASEAVRRRNPDLFTQPQAHDLPSAIKRQRGRPEGEFQDAVIAYAEARGWLCYHTFRSDKSTPGFPDLVMLRGHRQVVAELKHGDNRVTPEQDAWLRAFVDAGAQVYEWRDRDWPEIERVLR